MAETVKPVNAPLISAAGNAASGLFGIASTIINNRANRKLAMDSYNLQRKHALEDWERQTQYDSPAAMMARYKQAGINPNMVYGNQSNSPVVRSTPMDVPNLKPIPSPDFGGAVMDYMQVGKVGAQTALTEESIKQSILTQKLQNIAMASGMLKNKDLQFDLDLKNELRDITKETALSSLENIKYKNTSMQMGIEYNARTMEDRIKYTADRVANQQAGTAKAIQWVVESKAMLPYKKRQAEAQIGNILASTEGKKLQNTFDRITQGARVTATEYMMEYLHAQKGSTEATTAKTKLQNLLLENDVDMQGVRNGLEIIEGIKDAINPFKGAISPSTSSPKTPNSRSYGGQKANDPASTPQRGRR